MLTAAYWAGIEKMGAIIEGSQALQWRDTLWSDNLRWAEPQYSTGYLKQGYQLLPKPARMENVAAVCGFLLPLQDLTVISPDTRSIVN